MRKLHLLVIDPQNDFCDLPVDYCPATPDGTARLAPSLPVRGAHADLQRLAALVDAGRAGLDAITVTLDSHQHLDIAHPTFWRNADGSALAPFTQITAVDLRVGRYRLRDASGTARAQAYLDALEARGRYIHMVWPVHCEIGSWGHNIHYDLRQAFNRWEEARLANVHKVGKGENPWTEHYSALMAEVPDPADPATQLNTALLARLREADCLYIAGEAGSHCVKASTEHIVDNWPAGELQRIVLIRDCISPVAGFEAQYDAFLADMQARGVQIASAAQVTTALQASAQ
ncbi:MAG: hypothetical protein REI94_09770 [Moraxellaceae bacterium]|nr:hypothetical protein [Moraxellaceae bacterium]